MTATVVPNLIPISRVNGDWLIIDVPNGWDDVKKLTKKVLLFEGSHYTFRSWNSDRNDCSFIKTEQFATIKRK